MALTGPGIERTIIVKTTPVYGIPYVEDSDLPRDFPGVSRQQAEQIEDALISKGALPLDSQIVDLLSRLNAIDRGNVGPVAPEFISPYSGTCTLERINGFVSWAGNVSNTGTQFPNGYTQWGWLPGTTSHGAGNSPYRPREFMRTPVGTYNGYSANLIINPSADSLQVGYSSGTALSDAFYTGGTLYAAVP
ncbi:hypothetical protein [Curtobacterium phage Penoan]|nr:hypothetical protein [Curtobacterium phage Penoan]